MNSTKDYLSIKNYLSEGIVFFKDSKRLKNIALKIEKTSKYSSAEVGIVVSKIRGIASIFENLENSFAKAENQEDKEKIKLEFNTAKAKYTSFIKMINREGFAKALKASIDLGIISAAVFIGYKNIDIYKQKQDNPNLLPNVKVELKTQSVINGAITGASAASAIGFTMLFKKMFSNKGDDLYNKAKEALSVLERAEKMTEIKKVGNDE